MVLATPCVKQSYHTTIRDQSEQPTAAYRCIINLMSKRLDMNAMPFLYLELLKFVVRL